MNQNCKWLNLLSSVDSKYNNSKHSTINIKPIDVTKQNKRRLLETVYSGIKTPNFKMQKCVVEDHVCISKNRTLFSKGYVTNWSNKVFIVDKAQFNNPITYLLGDSKSEPISRKILH